MIDLGLFVRDESVPFWIILVFGHFRRALNEWMWRRLKHCVRNRNILSRVKLGTAYHTSSTKCDKVEGRQATSEVQSNQIMQAKQAINTKSTTTTDCACKCSTNLVLH